ncbi:alcohol dehydrogenase catalytic domain-containing protein [Streptomyces sp. LZ34]
MAEQVRGVVARRKGKAVSVETVVVPDPGPGEVVVEIQACGVCRTDMHYREGGISDDFPFLLGHEAAGVVETVGEGVTDVAPGDFVILNWRAVCGQCRACLRGRPWYCFDTRNAVQKMTLLDGTRLSPVLGIGAFVEKTLVAAGQCIKVDPAVSPAVASLLGCDVIAGIGATINACGFDVDVVIDAVGRPETYEQAFCARNLAGGVVLVGVPAPQMKLELLLVDMFGHGGVLKSSRDGDCLPLSDRPMLVDLYLQEWLDLEALVAETISLDDVEKAFERMHHGHVQRLVVMP